MSEFKNKTMREVAQNKKFGIIRKLENYYDEYDFMFSRFRGNLINLLEIGVQKGGSIATWLEYFPKAHIVGIDIDPECKQYERDSAKIYIGSQEDADFLKMVEQREGPFDIVIDDGGHTMKQNLTTFNTLFPLLKDGGIYVVEDLHTSYWGEFGGGLHKEKTMINRITNLIDDMHYWAINHPRAGIFRKVKHKLFNTPHGKASNIFEETVRSIYIADSICFIRKGKIEKDITRKI
jgi:hypothetical protein